VHFFKRKTQPPLVLHEGAKVLFVYHMVFMWLQPCNAAANCESEALWEREACVHLDTFAGVPPSVFKVSDKHFT